MRWGLPIERKDAGSRCRAWIYDKETKQSIKPLWWQTDDGKVALEITLRSGESAHLMVFARLQSEPGAYFIYQPVGNTGAEIQISMWQVGRLHPESSTLRFGMRMKLESFAWIAQ